MMLIAIDTTITSYLCVVLMNTGQQIRIQAKSEDRLCLFKPPSSLCGYHFVSVHELDQISCPVNLTCKPPTSFQAISGCLFLGL